MAGVWVVVTVFCVMVVTAFFALRWRRRHHTVRVWNRDAYPGLTRLNHWALGSRYVGIGVGLLVLPVAASMGRLGQGAFIAPAVLGCCIEVAIIVGEVVPYRAARQQGVAGLERRVVADYVSVPLRVGAVVALVWTAGLIAWGWQLASPGGRSFEVVGSVQGVVVCGGSTSPFLGSYYGMPLAVSLVVLVGLAVVALQVIARRPRNGADATLAMWDDALRRHSARAVLATAFGGLAASLVTAAMGLSAGQSMASSYVNGENGAQCQGTNLVYQVVFGPSVTSLASPAAEVLLVAALGLGFSFAVIAAGMVLAGFGLDADGAVGGGAGGASRPDSDAAWMPPAPADADGDGDPAPVGLAVRPDGDDGTLR